MARRAGDNSRSVGNKLKQIVKFNSMGKIHQITHCSYFWPSLHLQDVKKSDPLVSIVTVVYFCARSGRVGFFCSEKFSCGLNNVANYDTGENHVPENVRSDYPLHTSK